MLLLLMPEQVSNYWEEIKAGMNKALPPGPIDRDQRLLAKILGGVVQVWVSYCKDDEGHAVVDGVCLTSVIEDRIHDLRNLLLYALWAIGDSRFSTWTEGMEALKKYGSHNSSEIMCERVKGDYPCTCGLEQALTEAEKI